MSSGIEEIIEEIEEYVDGCKPSAFSPSKIIVNRDELESLLEELRTKTPEEIKRYQKIISNKEAILADAQNKADAIIAQAQIQTNELVSEHQIMQQAYVKYHRERDLQFHGDNTGKNRDLHADYAGLSGYRCCQPSGTGTAGSKRAGSTGRPAADTRTKGRGDGF